MAAAHIKNYPERIVDPQQKLIFDMREEIRSLRNENLLLRISLTSQSPGGVKPVPGSVPVYSHMLPPVEEENAENVCPFLCHNASKIVVLLLQISPEVLSKYDRAVIDLYAERMGKGQPPPRKVPAKKPQTRREAFEQIKSNNAACKYDIHGRLKSESKKKPKHGGHHLASGNSHVQQGGGKRALRESVLEHRRDNNSVLPSIPKSKRSSESPYVG